MQAAFAGGNVSLSRLVLHGKGFDLHASGELNRRLDLSAQISDFSRLIPGSTGTLRGDGWVRLAFNPELLADGSVLRIKTTRAGVAHRFALPPVARPLGRAKFGTARLSPARRFG